MHLFRRIALHAGIVFMTLAVFFGTPKAVESNATPLQSLFMIKQLLPQLKTVGLMWKKSDIDGGDLMNQIKRASAAVGAVVVVEDVESLPDVAAQFRDLTDNYHIQALWIIKTSNVLDNSIARSFLIKNAAVHGVALFGPTTDWVSQGACAAVVTDGGNTKLIVNQKTLNALGLKVPDKYASVTQVLATN